MRVKVTWDDGTDGKVFTIKGNVIPYVPAKLSGHPDTWYPDEGEEIEDITVYDESNTIIDTDKFLIDNDLTVDYQDLINDAYIVELESKYD